jgi:glycosyltransferase involved in cell wall biosynthesis
MNILYCTYFNLNNYSAGLNRINNLRDSVKKRGINIVVVGSGCQSGPWECKEKENYKQIFFNQKIFSSIRHSKAMKFIAEASKFYKNYLKEIVSTFKISGVIVYSPQGEMVGPIIRISKELGIFIVADCGEYYDFSIHNLLNGTLFQQAYFKYLQMKKLDGITASAPIWVKRANSLCLSNILLPGLTTTKTTYRKSPSSNKKNINIVFMGKLIDREIPEVIFEALSLCKKKGLNFKFQLIGTKNQNYREKYWIKKLRGIKELSDCTSFFGFVSNNKKKKILADSDIFIMLRSKSRETEHTFPSRVPEFMMSGNPVIISKVTPLEFYFKENYGVKFISCRNNFHELSDLIIELAKNPLKRFQVGKLGRKYAIKNFSLDKMGGRLSSFLFFLNKNRL